MQSLPATGEMAAVFAGEDRVATAVELYRERVSIAAVNGPAHTVISGERETLREVLRRLEVDGVGSRTLNVSHAFHSPLMESMMGEFERALRHVRFNPLRVPLVSGLTGAVLEAGARVDAGFWLDHARMPVRFDSAMRALAERDCKTFVEIGPDASLMNMGGRCLPGATENWLPSLRRGQGDWRVLLNSLAALSVSGAEVDWESFDRDYSRRRVSLPTYSFERKSYWLTDLQRRDTTAGTSEGYKTMRTEASPIPPVEETHAPTDTRGKEGILETLRAIVGNLLQTAPETLDVHASFLEMGADSIVLAEAMAAGKAIVASDIDGYRDVARDGLEALLVPPGDATALVAAVKEVLDDRRLAQSLGEAGARRAREFDWDVVSQRILGIYQELMS
jgi:acyl transferase domain-containing protein